MKETGMQKVLGYRRWLVVVCLICFSTFFLARCINDDDSAKSRLVKRISTNDFAGSKVCGNCHKSMYDEFIHTGHFLTSDTPNAINIKGSVVPGKNTFVYDSSRKVSMEKRDGGIFQVLYEDGKEKRSRRIDIVIGSGIRGQTYLSWIGNELFQLPVSYFAPSDDWANSPGYLPHKISFDRRIPSRCLECHSSFAKEISVPGTEPEQFDHAGILYGVGCERCHGPAANHVAFHSQNPSEKIAKFIIRPGAFTRQQSLELCALCHGGRLKKAKPSFQFMAGDALADYFEMDTSAPDLNKIDVHGNQYALLRASKCFRMSPAMTCTACHDTHKNERGQTALFSQRCLSCHNNAGNPICKMSASLGPAINQNCIDCHMPKKSSRLISVLLPGMTVPTAVSIRSHFISINR